MQLRIQYTLRIFFLLLSSMHAADVCAADTGGNTATNNAAGTPYVFAIPVNRGLLQQPDPYPLLGAAFGHGNAMPLQGAVTKSQSPFLEGRIETLPEGTRINIQMAGHLNSQISQKGDEVIGLITSNTACGQDVLLPRGWIVHGNVTDVGTPHRLGRNGYVEVEFDKLISPDGDYELPFNAAFSTHNGKLTAVSKVVATDTGYVGYGTLGGAILSAQLTGIPLAIATHGMSVAGGAAVGGTIGLYAALKRKGKICSVFPGDVVTMTVGEPMILPGFNPQVLSQAGAKQHLKGVRLQIGKIKFSRNPSGDPKSRLLTVDLMIANGSLHEFTFDQLRVVSDHSLMPYYPDIQRCDFALLRSPIHPYSYKHGELTFNVDGPRYKYFLVLLDKIKGSELSRVPLN